MRADRRIKYAVMLVIVIGSGIALLATTQPWYSFHFTQAAGHTAPVAVQGSAAAPALTALSLAGLALVAALAIAGRVIRFVLGALGVLLGACLILAAGVAAGNPIGSGSGAITTATGVSGAASVGALVQRVDETFWPVCAIVGGALVVIAAVGVIVTSKLWPGSSRRYQAVRFAPASDGEGAPPDSATRAPAENARDQAIDSWDELSRGDDPTA